MASFFASLFSTGASNSAQKVDDDSGGGGGGGGGGAGGGGVRKRQEVMLVEPEMRDEDKGKRRVSKPRPSTAPADASGHGGGGKIRVYVRVRPLSDAERCDSGRHFPVVEVASCGREVQLNEFCSMNNDYLRQRRVRQRRYRFDGVFGELSAQEHVFEATARPLVDAVLRGRNACCFCYGATGAGKTFTMLGTESNPGVMVLALQMLFASIDSGHCDETGERREVMLSYLEIYNETVRDLLDTSNDGGGGADGAFKGGGADENDAGAFGNLNSHHRHHQSSSTPQQPTLHMREDPVAGVVVQGLTQVRASSAAEVMQLLQAGNGRRTTESTRSNETSSRSHAVLQAIVYTYRDNGSGAGNGETVVNTSKLSLIDLAGSERTLASESKQSARCVEGANINKSLLALSGCINALVAGKKHIPYRNSKLTQLLKDSLGGGCMTAMIANLSPSAFVFSETSNTLHWADRAKQIRVSSRNISNTSTSKALVSRYNANSSGAQGGSAHANGIAADDARRVISSLEEQNRILSEKIRELESRKTPASAFVVEGGKQHQAPSTVRKHKQQRPMSAMPSTNLNPVSKTKALLNDIAHATSTSASAVRKTYNTRQQARRHSIAFTNDDRAIATTTTSAMAKLPPTKLARPGSAAMSTAATDASAKIIASLRAQVASLESEMKEKTSNFSSELESMQKRHRSEIDSLKREFKLKVKHKDDFIRSLITGTAANTDNGNAVEANKRASLARDDCMPMSPPVTRSATKRLLVAVKSTVKRTPNRNAGTRSETQRRLENDMGASGKPHQEDGSPTTTTSNAALNASMDDLTIRLTALSRSKSRGGGKKRASKRPFCDMSNTAEREIGI